MEWKDVVADPHLQNLPYKIETNEWGQIVMTPAKVMHGKYQLKIGMLLTQLMQLPGEATVECAIITTQGTKVADVVWASEERWQRIKDAYESDIAPEICVEVVSKVNSNPGIENKKQVYFGAGAQEVWTCDKAGTIHFYTTAGEIKASKLCPPFPRKIV